MFSLLFCFSKADAYICVADLDCDGDVDDDDLAICEYEFFNTCTEEEPCQCDLNYDNWVELMDLYILKTEYGREDCYISSCCDEPYIICTEENPCDIHEGNDLCPDTAEIDQDNYELLSASPDLTFCKGERVSIVHTKYGTHIITEESNLQVCETKCLKIAIEIVYMFQLLHVMKHV